MEINKEVLNGLSEEMRAQVDACATPEDLIALADKQGIELTDEQLQALSGGVDWDRFNPNDLSR